jgi:hypothetical protein
MELYCAFNIRNIQLIPVESTTTTTTNITSEDNEKNTTDIHCQYRLSFQLDALQPGKLTVAWLAQPYPTDDTLGVLA